MMDGSRALFCRKVRDSALDAEEDGDGRSRRVRVKKMKRWIDLLMVG